MTTAVQHV